VAIPGVPDYFVPDVEQQISTQLPDSPRQVGATTLYLAFTSLTGCIEGGQITQSPTAPLNGTVGTAPIVQLNVYIPHSGFGPDGQPGALIDAFDVTSGQFVDDVFVKVSPDADLTDDANNLGALSSKNKETVTAYPEIQTANANFDNWIILIGTGDSTDSIAKNVLTVGKNSNVAAFAFYQEPTGTTSGPIFHVTIPNTAIPQAE
jgi:hypothetical protein